MSGIAVALGLGLAHAPAGNAAGRLDKASRKAGGTCIAALWPNAVQSVVQGALYRLTWSGTPAFAVAAL